MAPAAPRQPLPGVACAHCGVARLVGTVFSRYFFVGSLPAFPVGKTSLTECQQCRQVLTGLAQMPPTRPYSTTSRAW